MPKAKAPKPARSKSPPRTRARSSDKQPNTGSTTDKPIVKKKKKKTPPKQIVVDATTNALLTAVFGVEVFGVFCTLLSGYIPKGCPLGPWQAAACVFLSCLLLFPTIFLVKEVSGRVGFFLSRTLLKPLGHPLKKLKSRRKFEDQCWQFVVHAAMTLLEVYILWYDDGGVPWLRDYVSLWTPLPWLQVNTKLSIHMLYLAQLAIWIVTCTSHRFFEERHKDYVMMFLHHLVTIGLIWLSYSANFVRIGTAVLFLHDSSDVIVDLVKITNYLKLEGPRGGFMVEILFLSNFFTWAYTRLYLFAYFVLWRGAAYGSREIVTAPGATGMESFTRAEGSPYTRGHQPGATIGDGSFDLIANVRALPTHDNLPLYWTLNIGLSALVVMHLIWYLLFWRMLFRLLKGSASDAAREEYEGDSD